MIYVYILEFPLKFELKVATYKVIRSIISLFRFCIFKTKYLSETVNMGI